MSMSDNARNKGRMAIYAMAGVYLLFMAHELWDGLPTSVGNQKVIMAVFMVLFVLIGAGMIVFGLVNGYKLSKPQSDTEEQEEEE